MYQHLILIYSDYVTGRRVAIHESYDSISEMKEFLKVYDDLKKEFSYINFGFHHLQTLKRSWESIIERDSFFTDVELVDIEEFKVMISNGTIITPMDIAKLILSKCRCTQLQLQKLVYFFWCRYMKKYDSYVFEDDFKAWPYGPVIDSLYEKFKLYKSRTIKVKDLDVLRLQVYSRIMKTSKSKEILSVLDEIIEQFGNCRAYDLVEKSHVPGGPWDIIYDSGKGEGKVIPKELIRDYVNA